jgi:anaerobic selenocysteine-containing dehydrogenase
MLTRRGFLFLSLWAVALMIAAAAFQAWASEPKRADAHGPSPSSKTDHCPGCGCPLPARAFFHGGLR